MHLPFVRLSLPSNSLDALLCCSTALHLVRMNTIVVGQRVASKGAKATPIVSPHCRRASALASTCSHAQNAFRRILLCHCLVTHHSHLQKGAEQLTYQHILVVRMHRAFVVPDRRRRLSGRAARAAARCGRPSAHPRPPRSPGPVHTAGAPLVDDRHCC